MTEQEGDKPHLQLVALDPVAQPTDQITDQEFATYGDQLDWMIRKLVTLKLNGSSIDALDFLKMLDPAEDNTKIKDWLADQQVLSRADFDKRMRRIQRERLVVAELGFLPQHELDYVKGYARENNITLTPRGTINRARKVALAPTKGQAETITADNCDACPEARLMYDVANAEGDNLDSFARELRLTASRLQLGYRDNLISDAIQQWQEECNRQMKVDAMLAIQFQQGRATGPAGQDMWAAMEKACFDVTETQPGFATAVVKKFMWQVKRKARGMTVTNHLMPVLTGGQGKGKTEFVKAMTKPLRDFMREVDFGMLTDGKTTDIWSALILFIDEMGHFTKADVDKVKNVITTTELSIRSMRQNHSAVIRNAATLIGCSNKDLGQLIRDETGGRRFAELEWSNTPDWEASNAIDWALLWQSVDENGPDPLFQANMVEVLREQQEANRNQHPVEIWCREFAHTVKNWKTASELHLSYRDWERDAFPRHDTSLTMFGRNLSNLISSMADFPLEKTRNSKSTAYRYIDRGGVL